MPGRGSWLRGAVLVLLPLLCVGASLFIGLYDLSPGDVLAILFHPGRAEAAQVSVVWQLRLPRTLAAALVGAALSVSGAAYQGAFRNPLVDAGMLGVSNGAGFGAALAIVALGGGTAIYPTAFAFAVLAVVLSVLAGRVAGGSSGITLILGGVIISAFFSAFTSILKYIADPYSQLPAITFWFMGSFADIHYHHFAAFLPMGVGILLVMLCRWQINVLSMGDREAAALGLDLSKYRLLLVGGATLATASAVCISGVISWVGLVVPHICRMLFGSDNRRLMGASLSVGASFLVVMDILARTLTTAEIPIGILTALVGTPFFIYLLKKTRGGGWSE
ncbi:FecCD family ABC transporter permease [uncultured Flavonifractor sp.]|uniref:FecCD family ABC transporter permease n=1 Tax=uncultured Flavonifractor sp. TaxID=1193534 RepID=UPI002612E5E4|nr:iron ABC transporter permease [uncultured Flavonifractor sp.]